jgi:hypothetical protein
MENSHPIATILDCVRTKRIIRTRLQLDRVESPPISPALLCVGDPPRDKDSHVAFQLHRLVVRQGKVFEFETFEEYEPQSVLPSQGVTYHFVRLWMPDQLTLAQSDPGSLRRYLFTPASPNDHDHCFLCWKVICECEDNDHEAYTNGRDSVCFECYDKYIASGFGKLMGDAA